MRPENMTDPFCELFPKMAACHYHRYGMGGREDDRHAICILGTIYVLISVQSWNFKDGGS